MDISFKFVNFAASCAIHENIIYEIQMKYTVKKGMEMQNGSKPAGDVK